MDLEFEVADLESVPEVARGFYEEKDGKHVLKVKGAVSKKTLDEFRDNNRALKSQVDKVQPLITLLGQDGLSPDNLQKRIDDLAEQRVKAMRDDYESKVQDLESRYTSTSSTLHNYILGDVVKSTALRHNVVESALPDVVNRASTAFTVVDGKVVAKEGLRNKKGEPLSVDDWFTTLNDSAPHFFGATIGAGATKTSKAGEQSPLSSIQKISAGVSRLRK